MKYVAMGLMLGIGLCAHVGYGEGLTFEVVEPVSQGTIMNIAGVNRQGLRQALEVHNLMFSIRGLAKEVESVSTTMKMRQLHEAQRDATEECSINKMADQFQDPAAVWDKMKAEYEARTKDLTIYFNSAEPATEEERKAFEAQMAKGEMTPQMIEESFASWRIGRDILMDVYQNQDKWGERPVSNKSTTFPLWTDQKYQYDKDWDQFYTALNIYFEVPPEGRPQIGDEKYDYAQVEKVQKAHEAYLALLTARNPVKAVGLAVAFKNPPVAPKPLPPKNEITFYLDAQTPEGRIYPEIPEPWQKYANEKFTDVAPNGEMAQDFTAGFNLKDSARKQPHGNRLETYQVQKETADSSARLESLSLEQADRRMNIVKVQISQLLQQDMMDLDLTNADVREKVLELLEGVKRDFLVFAEKEVKDQENEDVLENRLVVNWEELDDFAELKAINPAAFESLTKKVPQSGVERDQNLLKALKADMSGRVYLNEANAGEIEKMSREEKARSAFMAENHDMENMLAAAAGIKIDDTCINGGIR